MNAGTQDDGLRYTNAPERRQRILEHVTAQGFSTIAELSDAVAVSEMTVRRDVERLAASGAVRTVFGGVTAASSSGPVEPQAFRERSVSKLDAKAAIAQRALQIAGNAGTFYLDSGTTTIELARLLPDAPELTVMSHSLPVLVELGQRQSLTLIGVGGHFQHATQDFVDHGEGSPLQDVRIPLLFLAAAGIGEHGVFCRSAGEVLTKRRLVKASERVVLLADSAKFESSASLRACAIDEIDELITDDRLSSEHRKMVEDRGIVVNVVELPHTDLR